jgi:hypothetical protein
MRTLSYCGAAICLCLIVMLLICVIVGMVQYEQHHRRKDDSFDKFVACGAQMVQKIRKYVYCSFEKVCSYLRNPKHENDLTTMVFFILASVLFVLEERRA